MKVRLHIFIKGELDLPGVPFRQIMRDLARRNHVSGWVRFLPDGAAEAVLEGEEKDVDAVLRWAYTGPQGTKVREVEIIREPYTGQYNDFKIL
ncbi:MAG: acylphosphatase [Thermoproteus sp.]